MHDDLGFRRQHRLYFRFHGRQPIAGVLDDTATENSASIARITAQKALHTNLRKARPGSASQRRLFTDAIDLTTREGHGRLRRPPTRPTSVAAPRQPSC
jgi:hypothetical protein